jgi:hypothetical protein
LAHRDDPLDPYMAGFNEASDDFFARIALRPIEQIAGRGSRAHARTARYFHTPAQGGHMQLDLMQRSRPGQRRIPRNLTFHAGVAVCGKFRKSHALAAC